MAPIVENMTLYESRLSQSSEVFVSCLMVVAASLFVFSLVLLYRQAGLSAVYASMAQTQRRSLLVLDETARELRTLNAQLSARFEALRAQNTSDKPSTISIQQLDEVQKFAQEGLARVEGSLVPRALTEKDTTSTAF